LILRNDETQDRLKVATEFSSRDARRGTGAHMSAKLSFFGAAGCVTGACMLIETDQARVLVDCGLFQGPKTLKALNYESFPFEPSQIDAVLLTHAHVDHSGLLPKLVLTGFEGSIFATVGTIELCRVLLPDAGAIQEMEVESLNRRRQRRGENEIAPIFTRKDAETSLERFQSAPMDTWIGVAPGVRARWWDAGHILGAASIELEIGEGPSAQRLLFSGDIGPGGRDFTEDPRGPNGVDHLILEATYGDVERPPISAAARRDALLQEMLRAHAAGGPLLIPAFAVERTQELIIDLLELMETGVGPQGPIFLDSPLAIRACNAFLRHGRLGDGANPFARLQESSWLRYTESAAESRAIERWRGWCVIIAASGMCDAGRVRHHLKRLLWREQATVLLTGYQAIGTLGRLLQDGRKAVRIQGDEIKVRAQVRSINVYSGHADAPGLIAWAKARGPVSGTIFLTHGEPENLAGLERRLRKAGQSEIVVAELDQTYRIARTGRPAAMKSTPRVAPAAASRLDWHNARSEFTTRLSAQLEAAKDNGEREALLQTLIKTLEQVEAQGATSRADQ
jgi:metallo-beta-lactamase family protein